MKVNPRKLLIAAAVAAAVFWLFFRQRKREVLDPSNSPELAAEFDRLNPDLA